MRLIQKKDSVRFENGEFCIAFEYPMEDKDINGAVIELSGKYPTKGRVMNEVCKELVYVIKGSGKVNVEDKEFQLDEGDLFMINPGEKYFFDGKMTLCVPCSPAWYPKQHKEVE